MIKAEGVFFLPPTSQQNNRNNRGQTTIKTIGLNKPSAVEDAIRNGNPSPGNTPGTTIYTGPNGLTVVTGSGGQVITVIPK